MKTLSLRARLTLWYTVALVVVLALFGADVLVAQKRLGVRRADAEIADVHATVAKILGEELREHDSPAEAASEAREALGSLNVAIAIFNDRGAPLATGLGALTLGDLAPLATTAAVATIDTPSGEWRVASKPASFGSARFQLVVRAERCGSIAIARMRV